MSPRRWGKRRIKARIRRSYKHHTIYCPNCNLLIAGKAVYCPQPNCGAKLPRHH